MPFITEATSAIKSRFGFHSRSSASDSVPATPDLLIPTSSRENHSLSDANPSSAVRSLVEWDSTAPPPPPNQTQAQPGLSFEFSEDPAFWKDHNVQVIIRIRPLSGAEISQQGYGKCVRQESCQSITWTGHPESRFTFDLVADETVTQENMFKVAGVPMVENCMGGYNSCMFAYGQTGSGKTHTMLGDIEGGTRRHSVNCGMTPRVFEYLFSRIQKEKEAHKDEKLKFNCKCSFLEIYNEQILDLLEPSSNNLQIREDVKKGVHVENLKEIEVTCARDVMQQLIQGSANRKVAATNMNRASSRSHSVFTCIIESKWESQGVTHHRFARLNLVDLAGSERQKSSGAEGERLKEATNINKSLSTLGLVIMNLVSISNGKSLHVPYRDSKLTFLLQDSLGGNSKTIIIANISPSQCCSLETLSTLKFAQRAKFIKNNAFVNEDTSGDVLAMRVQIQQLKKEVTRLRSLVNGGVENQDIDCLAVSFPASPGSFKWEADKPLSQKKDYEAALVGAFRREKDRDMALKALAAENQAALQLAKQREDEIQGLKMRLRFREAGIKRLEAVASGKISAETHLLKEKEEHLKEIEVLRAQVDRNQEVTRFAMENLRLKEEIRRLKSFYEGGERELMTEQIMSLQNKLLEALDWKLMHESDSPAVQKENSKAEMEVHSELSSQEPGSPWRTTINEENEFLRMQAIQNRAEIETIQRQLDFNLEEKEKLERHVNDLVKQLEEERSCRSREEETQQSDLPHVSTEVPIGNCNDQMELKTMVDAIASASQREAEAHEKAITLSKENDELRLKLQALDEVNGELESKLKALIEEKNNLIEMYNRAASESNCHNFNKANTAEESDIEICNSGSPVENADAFESEMKEVVKNLEHQLMELHEENEKLMGLYEKAMHERDELRRMLVSAGQSCAPKVDNREESINRHTEYEEDISKTNLQVDPEQCLVQSEAQGDTMDSWAGEFPNPVKPLKFNASEDLNMVKMKLQTAEEKLSDSAKTLTVLGSVEKAFVEFEKLSKEIDIAEEGVKVKEQEVTSLEILSSEVQERKALIDNKLSALRFSISSFSSSVAYFEQREARARVRVNASSRLLNQKKDELDRLRVCKSELEASLAKTKQSEFELRKNHASLKSKLEEENRRRENERVLFAIDNIENLETPQGNWNLGGKATDLLKAEEEKTKLQTEIRLSREKIGLVMKEYDDLNKKCTKIESEMQVVQVEMQKASASMLEMEVALQGVNQEKETLLEVREKGISEIQGMILEYQRYVFDSDLKELEMRILDGEIQQELRRIQEFKMVKVAAAEKMTMLSGDAGCASGFLTRKMEDELRSVQSYFLEAKTILEAGSSISLSQSFVRNCSYSCTELSSP